MFDRPHHQKVHLILREMNPEFLHATKCYFGGGVAISLLLGEYRESVDIDFLCADKDGYRRIRESVSSNSLGDVFSGKVDLLRDVRMDRDAIRTVFSVDGTPIRFEIVREARIELEGRDVVGMSVPFLTRIDLFAEKLLANADRYADKSVLSRDVIDLLMMEDKWGPIPKEAFDKAVDAYGDAVHGSLVKAKEMLMASPEYFAKCITIMGIKDDIADKLQRSLGMARSKAPDVGR